MILVVSATAPCGKPSAVGERGRACLKHARWDAADRDLGGHSFAQVVRLGCSMRREACGTMTQ